MSELTESTEGINCQDFNYVKCWLAVIKIGRETLSTIFNWGCCCSPRGIEQLILENMRYTKRQYRSEFDKSQREKIISQNKEEFDIALFYLLLQRICKLPKPSSTSWTREGDPNSLANILYRIKCKRNHLAHSNTNISFEKMITEFQSLTELFNDAITTAGKFYRLQNVHIYQELDRITAMMECIRDSDNNNSLAMGKIEDLMKEKISLAKSECRTELRQYYCLFTRMSLSPWTSCNKQHDIQNIFTDPLLKLDSNNTFQNQLRNYGTIRLENLLVTPLQSGDLPTLITILSRSGYGKTTIAKFIIDCWSRSLNNIKTLEEYEILFYVDFRNSLVKNFDDILLQSLPHSCSIFGITQLKQCLLSMNILFILDNVNDTKKRSIDLLEFICKINSPKIKIIATSHQDPYKLKNAGSPTRKHLTMHLYGLHEAQIPECLTKISWYVARSRNLSREKINTFCRYFLDINTGHSLLHSPEVISHTFFHWLTEMSAVDDSTSTRTELHIVSLSILRNNIVRMMELESKEILQKIVVTENISAFFNAVYLFAFETMSVPFLSFEQVKKLIQLGKEVLIPYNYLLSEMFTFQEKFRKKSLKNCFKISFPSISVQLFYSSMHILNLMLIDHSHLNNCVLKLIDQITNENLMLIYNHMIGICNSSTSYPKDFSNHIVESASQHIIIEKNQNFSFWMDIICESRFNMALIEKIFNYMGPDWKIEDYYLSNSIIKLLEIVEPNELSIVVTDNKYIGNVSKILMSCFLKKNINLHVYLYCHFWMKNDELSDHCISLDGQLVQYNIKSLAANLSYDYYQRLPQTINHLALQVKHEEIIFLNRSLERLPLLKFLCINVDIPLGCDINSIQEIRLPRKDIVLYVHLWNVDHQHISWACKAVAKMSPAFSCLALRKTQLNFDSAKDWVDGLCQKRIHVDEIIIGSCIDIGKDRQTELQQLASNFECSSFKWILR